MKQIGVWAVLAALAFNSAVNASVSVNTTFTVYKKLIKDNYLFNPPLLYIIQDDDDNAYSSIKGVEITTGMLKTLKNKEELARVLGHELGHYYLKHNGSTVEREYEADAMASVYMSRANYNVCKGALMLKRRNSAGNNLTHPSDIKRYLKFNCK